VSAFSSLGDLGPLPIWTGILARVVEGREMTFAVVELDAHAVALKHDHPNEQIGIVLRGKMTFTVGGETRELGPGDTYVIRGNTPHEATAGPEGAVVIDVFSPLRADWRRLDPLAPKTPVWP
jgi:quercetin dioxygenase-like cupin family protein